MSALTDLKKHFQEARKIHFPWIVKVPSIIIGACAVFILGIYGQLSLALPLMNIIIIIGLTVAIKWKLRHKIWFIVSITIIIIFHITLLFIIPWGVSWVPAAILTAINSVDICLILLIINAIAKIVEQPS